MLGVLRFRFAVRTNTDPGHQVRPQYHQRGGAHQRIAARTAPAGASPAEVLAILGAVAQPQRDAIDAEDGQLALAIEAVTLVDPGIRRHLEEPPHQRFTELGSGPWHHRSRQLSALRVEHQVQASHHVVERPIAKQSHADDEPRDLFRRKSPSPKRDGPGGAETVLHPLLRNLPAEPRQVFGVLASGGDQQRIEQGRRRSARRDAAPCSSKSKWAYIR